MGKASMTDAEPPENDSILTTKTTEMEQIDNRTSLTSLHELCQ